MPFPANFLTGSLPYAIGYDTTRENIPSLPRGAQVYAGYSTGSPGWLEWDTSDFDAHATSLGPCLQIDQDPAATDGLADYLDVENGAATPADCPGWSQRAMANFKAARRPGQRSPAIYVNGSNITQVANSLVAGGVTSGVGLILASWDIGELAAIADVMNASGPFPIVGVQFADPGPYDINVYDMAWLLNQAGKVNPDPPPPPPPPGSWTFPAPQGLAASNVSSGGYRLDWRPVTGLHGEVPDSYTVQTYQLNGVQVDKFTTTDVSTAEYGAGGGGLHPGWTYITRVWANGAPSAPPHAQIQVHLNLA